MRIFAMIEQGTITAAQAAALIHALEEAGDDELPAGLEEPAPPEQAGDQILFEEPPAPAEAAPPAEEFPAPDFGKWRYFWFIPLGVGVVITGLAGLLVYAGMQGGWNWFWMACAWLPLLFGALVMALSVMSRTALWLHVRVHTGEDEWPRRILISFPLPVLLTAWGLRLFGQRIPGMQGVRLDQAVLALKKSATPGNPLYVRVDEPNGVRVQVYIG
jgi:uncharacterized membrane protein YhdT